MTTRICGFAKVRNEIVRGNLYRCLANLEAVCDSGIVCDDASTDGTAEILESWALERGWIFLQIPAAEQRFENELAVKQQMLDLLGDIETPSWVWWLDGDETLDAAGTARLPEWVASLQDDVKGVRFHYTQLWREVSWARTDDGFDGGEFAKLWRWRPDLSFDTRTGILHRQQFPTQIEYAKTLLAPFDVIHWGNVGKALVFKAIQYSGGLGGVDRHLAFGHTVEESLATGEGYDKPEWSKPHPTYRRVDASLLPEQVVGETRTTRIHAEPEPFSMGEIRRIRSMGNMRGLEGWFTVCIPTFNRMETLPRALDSLRSQVYGKWIAVILDDGSTDATQALAQEWQRTDPRIFYCRYEKNVGGVAMNELGMAMACEFTEYWSRLGSDDWWGPEKLAEDVAALAHHEAIFGPFSVFKHGRVDHTCAGSWGPENGASPSERLRRGEFLASWANVAVKTSVLRKVREKHGNFCDPALRNMEDFLVNARIAHVADWTWRLGSPASAFWNCLEAVGASPDASASANAAMTTRDKIITDKLIAEMQSQASR